MDGPVIRTAILGGLLAALSVEAVAHQMVVFASVDCKAVTVETEFSNGNAVQQADVRVLDGDNGLQTTLPIYTDGTVMVPLDSVDYSGGLVIEDEFIGTESITHSLGDGDTHSNEGLASYVWLDLGLAIAQAQAIAAALTARGLVPAEEVKTRLAALTAELETLEATAQSALQDLSDAKLIATHPRYYYFARCYGMSVLSIELEVGAMPDERQFAELEALDIESGATLLIWEAQPPDAALDATRAFGLQNVVFQSLEHSVEGQTIPQDFAQALFDMAEVAGQ